MSFQRILNESPLRRQIPIFCPGTTKLGHYLSIITKLKKALSSFREQSYARPGGKVRRSFFSRFLSASAAWTARASPLPQPRIDWFVLLAKVTSEIQTFDDTNIKILEKAIIPTFDHYVSGSCLWQIKHNSRQDHFHFNKRNWTNNVWNLDIIRERRFPKERSKSYEEIEISRFGKIVTPKLRGRRPRE